MANILCVSNEWNLGFDDIRELANAGFRVFTAGNGYEAIGKFASREIDAVLVNRQLPDLAVEDLVNFLKHHSPAMPVIMVSAVMPVADAPAAVDAVIGKHNCAALLIPTLDTLIPRKQSSPYAAGDNSAPLAA